MNASGCAADESTFSSAIRQPENYYRSRIEKCRRKTPIDRELLNIVMVRVRGAYVQLSNSRDWDRIDADASRSLGAARFLPPSRIVGQGFCMLKSCPEINPRAGQFC